MLKASRFISLGIFALIWPLAFSWAASDIGTAPDRGYVLEAGTPKGIPQAKDSSARIEGKISLVGRKNGEGTCHQAKNCDFIAELKDNGVSIRAFFPDLTTEVTSSLSLGTSGKHGSFRFDTPNLSIPSLNTFVIQLFQQSNSGRALEIIKAKIDRRILGVRLKIDEIGAKADSKEVAVELGKLLEKLQALSSRIEQKLALRTDLLAEYRLPLQVGNEVAAAGANSTVMGKFRFSISSSPIGSAIEGEKSVFNGSILNLRKPDESTSSEEDDRLIARFFWGGTLVKEIGPASIPGGSSVLFSFESPKLLPENSNTYTISLHNVDEAESGDEKRVGEVSFKEPVADDPIAPHWLVGSSPDESHPYVQFMQEVSAKLVDDFGLIDRQSIKAALQAALIDGSSLNRDVTQQLAIASPDQGQTFSVFGDVNPLPEGSYTLTLGGADLAGNAASPLNASFRIDRTAPALTLGMYPRLTKYNNHSLSFEAFDHSPFSTRVTLNGTQILETSEIAANVSLELVEGFNMVSIQSRDQAGNEAAIQLDPIELDTIPPVMANLYPSSGTVVNTLSIPVSFNSNEPLSEARINGALITLSSDGRTASGSFQAITEGEITLSIEAIDKAGNRATQQVTAQIMLRALNPALLSIVPVQEGSRLEVHGAPGATRPGLTVYADASFFNKGSAIGATDGSFVISLFPFRKVTIKATDPALGRTDTAELLYGSDAPNLLAGTVRDIFDQPLANATVRIANSDLSVRTDASGTFEFRTPPTGDQLLVVDGSSISQPLPPAPGRRYGTTNIAINIGVSQSTVLNRPIYLAHTPLDGSAVSIDVASGGSVSDSVNAPGVELEIEPASAVFPDGASSGLISIAAVDAKFSTIEPPSFAVPKRVISLEPSGMRFTKPVEVTLPNWNHLPVGLDVVILSMNSSQGSWEIGGVGTVVDENTIKTKPNMGIVHFSQIYASPAAPKVAQLGGYDKPGADTFDAATSTSIVLPSYKSNGVDISPSLSYRSSWARPTALVTNVFKLPREELSIDWLVGFQESAVSRIESRYKARVTNQVKEIRAQFATTGIETEEFPFSAPESGYPEEAAVSFAVEMKKSDGFFMKSGSYPYVARYEIDYEELTVHSAQQIGYVSFPFPHPIINTQPLETKTKIHEFFPPELTGSILVRNEVESPVGPGWRINGPQRIINPDEGRILIEESDGSVSTYAIKNTMQTLVSGDANQVDLGRGVDLYNWPTFTAITSDDRFAKGSLLTGDVSERQGSLPKFSGRVSGWRFTNNEWDGFDDDEGSICQEHQENFTIRSKAGQLVTLPDGNLFGTDEQLQGLIKRTPGSNGSLWVYESTNPPTYSGNFGRSPFCDSNPLDCPEAHAFRREEVPQVQNYCRSIPGIACTLYSHVDYRLSQGYGSCGFAPGSSGEVPLPDFNGDGDLFVSKTFFVGFGAGFKPKFETRIVPGRRFNNPKGISPGPRPNTFVIADSGNNRVRLIDLQANTIQTVAGDGNAGFMGDGGKAISAKLDHPQGVTYDGVGNLYISTKDGTVRVVDPQGFIRTLVGAPGSTPGDNRPASEVRLSSPFGLIVDHRPQSDGTFKNSLYIAETGAGRVRKVDLDTGIISTIAGTGQNSPFNGDNLVALNSNLNLPTLLGLDPEGNVVVVDSGNQRIRRIVFENQPGGILAFEPASRDNSILVRLDNGSWERKYRNGTKSLFDSSGKQTALVDRVQRQVKYSYDPANGNLISITDVASRITQYDYVGGRLKSITDPAQRSTRFDYYLDGRLERVIFPDQTSRRYVYDEKHRLRYEYNERDVATEYSYNEWNRVESVTRAKGTPDESKILMKDMASQTVAQSGAGGQMRALAEVENTIQQAGSSVSFSVGNEGYVSIITDSGGKKTKFERNFRGQPTRILRNFIEGSSETSEDDLWDSEVVLDYNDQTGDLLSQRDSLTGIQTSQKQDAYGNIYEQTNARGKKTYRTFDPDTGLLQSETSPLGHTSEYQYYPDTNLVSSVSSKVGSITISSSSFSYDAFGNLLTSHDAIGNATSSERDLPGNIQAVTRKDPSGTKSQTTIYERDEMNRLRSVTSPKMEKTSYSYSLTGHLAVIEDHDGRKISFHHDALDRVFKKVDQLGKESYFKYNSEGNVVEERDPNNNVKTFEYDSSGRPKKKILPDDLIEMSYDRFGNLAEIKNNGSIVEMKYSVAGYLGRVESYSRGSLDVPRLVLNYTHDENGNRRSVSDSFGGSIAYEFDDIDRLTRLENHKGEIYLFTADDLNRELTLVRPGSETVTRWDPTGFVSNIVHKAGSSTLSSLTYGRDYLGNRSSVSLGAGIDYQFVYDQNNQLVSSLNPEVNGSFAAETFSYDSIGNRTSDQVGSFTYDQFAQRLSEDYRYFYYWDDNGNLTSKQAKAGFPNGEVINYSYSSQNQLVSFRVFEPGNASPVKEVKYVYDALGRRVQREVVDFKNPSSSFVRRFAYDGQEVFLEFDGNNQLLARYTHSGLRTDDVLAVDVTEAGVSAGLARSAISYQYLKDVQGSIFEVVDNSGNRIQRYLYSAFGVLLGIQDASASDVTGSPPLNTSFGFTGRELDRESGMMYYRARYYDPAIGRFLQKDPHPGQLELPITVSNTHIYVGNSPYNLTDPSGESFLGDFFNVVTDIFSYSLWAAASLFADLSGLGELRRGITLGVMFAAATGGAGVVAGTAVGGGVVGAGAGALAGGVVGGVFNVATGRGSFWFGFISGAIAGGFAGYSAFGGSASKATVDAPLDLASVDMTGIPGVPLGQVPSFEWAVRCSLNAVKFLKPFGGASSAFGTPVVEQPYELDQAMDFFQMCSGS